MGWTRFILDPNLARKAVEEGREIIVEFTDKHFRATIGGKSKHAPTRDRD